MFVDFSEAGSEQPMRRMIAAALEWAPPISSLVLIDFLRRAGVVVGAIEFSGDGVAITGTFHGHHIVGRGTENGEATRAFARAYLHVYYRLLPGDEREKLRWE